MKVYGRRGERVLVMVREWDRDYCLATIKKTLYILHYYNIYGIIKKKLENYNLKWG